jgi:S-disulfanyl-L-cysteine oxidoreductase SoxD
MHRSLACITSLGLLVSISLARAEGPNLGTPINPADIGSWDISVMPDGKGLPPGNGTPAQGQRMYAEKCSACHGEDGRGVSGATGAPLPPLFSAGKITDISAGMKTIANFWPYSTTLFDYIRRSMPWNQPRSLTDEEVYALTAFILSKNKLIGENDVMDAETLPKVRMPNRDGFITRFPDKI